MEGMAESHIEAWITRYEKQSYESTYYDLNVNHDFSLEVEYAEETLKRELSGDEIEEMESIFIDKVLESLKETIYAEDE